MTPMLRATSTFAPNSDLSQTQSNSDAKLQKESVALRSCLNPKASVHEIYVEGLWHDW